jgi:hypothetical protein
VASAALESEALESEALESEALIDDICTRLQGVDGLVAIVLGGSRATGTHHAASDIDVGLYYVAATPPDLTALRRVAATLDDAGRGEAITPLGAWGPWINGGGWLRVQGRPVDFLYRDLTKVRQVVAACRAGEVEIAYQPGHPHGFVTSIYMGEVAYARTLWDPTGALAELKQRTLPYPAALRQATQAKFLWEAGFSLENAQKAVARGDVAYVAGCCFRTVACLMQVLFAHNGRYLLNEKGAVAQAATFPHRPDNLEARIQAAFGGLQADPAALNNALLLLTDLVDEVEGLAAPDGTGEA